jgi:hypothetical protein
MILFQTVGVIFTLRFYWVFEIGNSKQEFEVDLNIWNLKYKRKKKEKDKSQCWAYSPLAGPFTFLLHPVLTGGPGASAAHPRPRNSSLWHWWMDPARKPPSRTTHACLCAMDHRHVGPRRQPHFPIARAMAL